MTRRSKRFAGQRRDAQRGLTMVEILVTIVLSSLFFAALVPVFVMASQQGQTDKNRVLATNAAQSAIEVMRDLPYDDLYDLYLDPDAAADVVEPHWKGDNSDMAITVEPVPATADKGEERYLSVSVTTSWTAWKGRQRSVTLRTAVYRQGLGTHTLTLYAYPLEAGFIRQVPVNVVARMDAADGIRTLRVDFEVWASNGSVVDQWTVYSKAEDRELGTEPVALQNDDGYWYYSAAWTAEDLLDGSYTFIATTRPIDPTPDDTTDPLPPSDWSRKVYVLDLHVPEQPTIEECMAGFQASSPGGPPVLPQVSLAWDADITDADVGHVEILRNGIAADGVTALPAKSIVLQQKWATHYVDRDVTVGATYLYQVMVEDAQGHRGEWSATTSCKVVAAGTAVAPPAPRVPLSTLVVAPGVTLTWVDPTGTPDIDYYRVYRDTSLTVPLATVPFDQAPTYPDPFSEYGGTYTYVVTAVNAVTATDAEGNPVTILTESVPLAAPPVMVPEPPKVGMRITVSAISPLPSGSPIPSYARVVVQSLSTGDFYPLNTWEYPKLRMGKKADVWNTGNVFYPGRYQVIAMFYTNTGRCGTYNEPVQLGASSVPINVQYMGPN